VILTFSRYVVGWMIATARVPRLQRSFGKRAMKQNVGARKLTMHARSRILDEIQARGLVVGRPWRYETHRRPHVVDDQSYSESQFKTEVSPGFPDRFGDRRRSVRLPGIFTGTGDITTAGSGLLTPETVQLRKAYLATRSDSLSGSRF